MTPEDFEVTVLPTGDITLLCPVDDCSWREYYEETFLWDLLRDAKNHIVEKHDS